MASYSYSYSYIVVASIELVLANVLRFVARCLMNGSVEDAQESVVGIIKIHQAHCTAN